jgi:RHS repeat-associated protein
VLFIISIAGCAQDEPKVQPPLWSAQPDITAFEKMEKDHLAAAQRSIQQILDVKGARTVQNTLVPYDNALMHFEDVIGLSNLIQLVHPDASFRDRAASTFTQAYSGVTALFLNRVVYQALSALDLSNADPATQYYVERQLLEFRNSGADRDDATRERVKKLNGELTNEKSAFTSNITNVADKIVAVELSNVSELDGLPQDYIDSHKPDADGRIRITDTRTDMLRVMSLAKSESLRRRLYLAHLKLGYPENRDALIKMMQTRYEIATLLGYSSWADYWAGDKMLRNGKSVEDFLHALSDSVRPTADRETALLLAEKRKAHPEAKKIFKYDEQYLQEKIRRSRYGFDSAAVRPYFPYNQVKQGILDTASKLFHVSFQQDSFAGITLSDSYNNRLQPNEIKASSTAGIAMDLSYSFVDASSHNNGNVMGITNNLDTTRSQVFTYDQLNRIVTAGTTSTYATSPSHCWGEAYVYDNNITSAGEFGNLTNINVASSSYNGCTQESLSVTATTNNQLSATGFSYDASGNLLTDGTNTYGFNAESEIKSAAGVNYTYDGDGNRLQKSNGKIYWYGAGTEILDESDASGNITDEYVYFGGQRFARRDSSGNIVYYVADHLGTSRVVTSSTGTVLDQSDFYPFGGERVIASSSGNVYKFEGKERDTETNNDDFSARYYSSRFGRWLSPDWSAIPAPVPYANLTNPQTLNLYAMVSDNPETFADLDGHCDPEMVCDPGDTLPNAATTLDFFKGVAKEIGNIGISTLNSVSSVDAPGLDNPSVPSAIPQLTPSSTIQDAAMGGTAGMSAGLSLISMGAGVADAVAGARATAAVPDANIVVRGGTGEMPPAGTTFSGAHGATLEEAASGVPHGTIRTSTAGDVRDTGGTVKSAPELTRSGVMNERHVNVTEGTNNPSTFSQPRSNPVPKKDRIQ